MADSPALPGQHAWKLGQRGELPLEFYKFFRDWVAYQRQTQGDSAALAALEARVAALEDEGSADILGLESVLVLGSLESGQVQLRLDGDSLEPGASLYYGTDILGVKGYHPALSNPMTTEGDLIVGGVAGAPDRLGIGAADQVLGEIAGSPAWVDRLIEIVAGAGVSVDVTDPMRPVISAAGPSGAGSIGATFDGGGAVLTPGVFVDVLVPFNCTITAATVLADQSGAVVFSVLADPYASFPPATNIAPTTPPTISGSDKSQDSTLSGWTTAIAAGTVVRFGVVSCTSIQRATLTLEVTKL